MCEIGHLNCRLHGVSASQRGNFHSRPRHRLTEQVGGPRRRWNRHGMQLVTYTDMTSSLIQSHQQGLPRIRSMRRNGHGQ